MQTFHDLHTQDDCLKTACLHARANAGNHLSSSFFLICEASLRRSRFRFLFSLPFSSSLSASVFLPLLSLTKKGEKIRKKIDKPRKKISVSYCINSKGCDNGVRYRDCLLKHVADIYNPEDYHNSGARTENWVSATLDRTKGCRSVGGDGGGGGGGSKTFSTNPDTFQNKHIAVSIFGDEASSLLPSPFCSWRAFFLLFFVETKKNSHPSRITSPPPPPPKKREPRYKPSTTCSQKQTV